MDARVESQLQLLADEETTAQLIRMGFDWSHLDANVAGAARFKRRTPTGPVIVGLVGGASSGKSTIFNSLLDREVSRVSAHAHETRGPVAAVDRRAADQFISWINDRVLFSGLEPVELNGSSATDGGVGAIHVFRAADFSPRGRPPGLKPEARRCASNMVVVDLPDVTSRMSSDEGSVTRNLLPWFDGLLVVVDEERWFDAVVFDEVVAFSRNFGSQVFVVFNRTERTEALSPEHQRTLSEHAAGRHASDCCVSPYSPGSGYRPVSAETRRRIDAWITGLDNPDARLTRVRSTELEQHLRRRCAAILTESVARSQQFGALQHDIEKEVAALTEQTRLSADLLTSDERRLLGLGHRFVPLFDLVQSVRRWFDWPSKRRTAAKVDFDKSVEALAEVLRRNLEHRFRHATARIDRLIQDNAYLGDDRQWRPTWSIPPFDEREWAARIRAHIDAWKAETSKQARAGDVAAVAVGTPLLLLDLLFLGGAGMSLAWTATWVAGFLGGKGLVRAFQDAPAFAQYQTTVGAYQAFVRESLREQSDANIAAIPRRHLAMSDPRLAAAMAWSTPTE